MDAKMTPRAQEGSQVVLKDREYTKGVSSGYKLNNHDHDIASSVNDENNKTVQSNATASIDTHNSDIEDGEIVESPKFKPFRLSPRKSFKKIQPRSLEPPSKKRGREEDAATSIDQPYAEKSFNSRVSKKPKLDRDAGTSRKTVNSSKTKQSKPRHPAATAKSQSTSHTPTTVGKQNTSAPNNKYDAPRPVLAEVVRQLPSGSSTVPIEAPVWKQPIRLTAEDYKGLHARKRTRSDAENDELATKRICNDYLYSERRMSRSSPGKTRVVGQVTRDLLAANEAAREAAERKAVGKKFAEKKNAVNPSKVYEKSAQGASSPSSSRVYKKSKQAISSAKEHKSKQATPSTAGQKRKRSIQDEEESDDEPLMKKKQRMSLLSPEDSDDEPLLQKKQRLEKQSLPAPPIDLEDSIPVSKKSRRRPVQQEYKPFFDSDSEGDNAELYACLKPGRSNTARQAANNESSESEDSLDDFVVNDLPEKKTTGRRPASGNSKSVARLIKR